MPPLGTTTRQQRRRYIALYTSFNSAHARPRPAPKCIVQKRANIVSVKMRRINCRLCVLRSSNYHRSTKATISLSTYCPICFKPSHLNVPIRMQRSSLTTDQRHGYGILQRTHALPNQVLHCALLVQRQKRHVHNNSNVSNATGASTAPTNPPHCKKHLLPTSPIHVSCSLKNCVSPSHKTAPCIDHVCPKS